MNIAHQKLIVDINKTDTYQVLEMKQGDKKSRYIDITVTASGSPFVLSSVADEASFAASLSGKLVQLESFGIDSENNVVTVLIDENALALAGTLNCEISLIKDGACITSATFYIKVGASAKGFNAILHNPSEKILKAFLDAIGWEEASTVIDVGQINTYTDLVNTEFIGGQSYIIHFAGAIDIGDYICTCYEGDSAGTGAFKGLRGVSFKDGKAYQFNLLNGGEMICTTPQIITSEQDYINAGFYMLRSDLREYGFNRNCMYMFEYDGDEEIPCAYYSGRCWEYNGVRYLEFTKSVPDGTIYILNLDDLTVEIKETVVVDESFIYAGTFNTVGEMKSYGFSSNKMYMFYAGAGFDDLIIGFEHFIGRWYKKGDYEYLEFAKPISDGKAYTLNLDTRELSVKDIADIDQSFIYAGTFNLVSEMREFGFSINKIYMFRASGELHSLGLEYGTYIGTYSKISDNEYIEFSAVNSDGKIYLLNLTTKVLDIKDTNNNPDYVNIGYFNTREDIAKYPFEIGKMYMFIYDGDAELPYKTYNGRYYTNVSGYLEFTTAIPDGKIYSLNLDTLELTIVDANEKDFIYIGSLNDTPSSSKYIKTYKFDVNKTYRFNLESDIDYLLSLEYSKTYIGKYYCNQTDRFLEFTTAVPDGKIYTLNIDTLKFTVIDTTERDFIYAGYIWDRDHLLTFDFKTNKLYWLYYDGDIDITAGFYFVESESTSLTFRRCSYDGKTYYLNCRTLEVSVHDVKDNYNQHSDYFHISDDGELSIKSSVEHLPHHLTIPEVVNEIAVNKLQSGMFKGNTRIQSVTFPDTIDEIPDECFNECVNLRYLHNTEHIKKIGSKAFRFTRIEKAVFPNLEELGASAFTNVPHLAYADVGKVTTIPDKAFKYCHYLSKVVGTSVTTVGAEAFEHTARLINVDFVDNLTSVGDYAFWITRFDYEWSNLSGLSENATYAQVNPTDFWSEATPTPCENPTPTALCQRNPEWAAEKYNGNYSYGAYGCFIFCTIHAVCGLYNLSASSPADFADKVGKSDLWNNFSPNTTGLVNALSSIPAPYNVNVEKSTSWDATNLNKLYTTLKNGGYAIVRVGSPKEHGILVYGVNENKELLCLDSERRYPYDETKAFRFKLPFNKLIANNTEFVLISNVIESETVEE